MMGRPLAAYGNLIHNQCERRPHFEFGEFATEWGDEGAQKGWCLYKLGCKGPETMGNCPTVRYGENTSWNVRSGHGCIGCMTTSSWNAMGPAYKRLPSPVPFLPNVTVDMVGAAMVGGIAAVAGVHAVGMGVRYKRRGLIAAREAAAGAPEGAVAVADVPGEGAVPAPPSADAAVALAAGPPAAGTADTGAAAHEGGAAPAGDSRSAVPEPSDGMAAGLPDAIPAEPEER